MEATVSDISLGREWLRQMGEGARKNGMCIQYCMSPSRHAMQSLEVPVVTQVFCSFRQEREMSVVTHTIIFLILDFDGITLFIILSRSL